MQQRVGEFKPGKEKGEIREELDFLTFFSEREMKEVVSNISTSWLLGILGDTQREKTLPPKGGLSSDTLQRELKDPHNLEVLDQQINKRVTEIAESLSDEYKEEEITLFAKNLADLLRGVSFQAATNIIHDKESLDHLILLEKVLAVFKKLNVPLEDGLNLEAVVEFLFGVLVSVPISGKAAGLFLKMLKRNELPAYTKMDIIDGLSSGNSTALLQPLFEGGGMKSRRALNYFTPLLENLANENKRGAREADLIINSLRSLKVPDFSDPKVQEGLTKLGEAIADDGVVQKSFFGRTPTQTEEPPKAVEKNLEGEGSTSETSLAVHYDVLAPNLFPSYFVSSKFLEDFNIFEDNSGYDIHDHRSKVPNIFSKSEKEKGKASELVYKNFLSLLTFSENTLLTQKLLEKICPEETSVEKARQLVAQKLAEIAIDITLNRNLPDNPHFPEFLRLKSSHPEVKWRMLYFICFKQLMGEEKVFGELVAKTSEYVDGFLEDIKGILGEEKIFSLNKNRSITRPQVREVLRTYVDLSRNAGERFIFIKTGLYPFALSSFSPEHFDAVTYEEYDYLKAIDFYVSKFKLKKVKASAGEGVDVPKNILVDFRKTCVLVDSIDLF
jgi:hypothetical protein